MTRLFTMKSLAFAGAAAFALALAAAPQADAAEAAKPGIKLNSASVTSASITVSSSAVNVVDGKVEYYYGIVKNNKTKWTSVTTERDCKEEDGNYTFTVPVGEIAKGKATTLVIAADSTGDTLQTEAIECKATPKIKVALKTDLSSGPSITVQDKNKQDLNGTVKLASQYGGYEMEVDVNDSSFTENGDVDLMKFLEKVADAGGSSFTVTYQSTDAMEPAATAKLKVSATPKAPKIGLKLAKAVSVSFKNAGYTTFKATDTAPKKGTDHWVKTVDKQDLKSLSDLFGDSATKYTSAQIAESVIPDDAYVLPDNMKVQAYTLAKSKKLDSRIATSLVYASAPTPSSVNVEISNSTKTTKGETEVNGAKIKFKVGDLTTTQAASGGALAVTLQNYDTEGKKWKDVTDGKEVTFKDSKFPDYVFVRVKGGDYKVKGSSTTYYEAPGHIMAIKLDEDDPENDSAYATTDSSILCTKGAIKQS